jgi:RNA polymerase sigma-70 factor (ECF subfamily)
LPDEPEIMGLLALMLLIASRRRARISDDGDLVLLADQDRSLWDPGLVVEGQSIVRRCLSVGRPGPYQIQAAINAVHSDASSTAETDWSQILTLYDQLMTFTPTPIVALNRAVAVAEVQGPDAALATLSDLALDDFHMYHAIRADLLRRAGRPHEAIREYDTAIVQTENAVEREFLERRRAELH